MPQYIEVNGETVEFPDSMSDEDIVAAISGMQGGETLPGATVPMGGVGSPRDVAGEFASAANRSLMEGFDFLVPGTLNAALRVAGSDYQVPTFAEMWSHTPGAQGGFMPPGTPRDVVVGAGGAAPAALAMTPIQGRNLATPAGALADFMGFGTAQPAPGVAPLLFPPGGAVAAPPGTAPVGAEIPWPYMGRLGNRTLGRYATGEGADLAQQGSESASRAGIMVDPYTQRAVPDIPGKNSVKQGFAEDFVAMVEASNPETRAKLLRMMDTLENSMDNRRAKLFERPLDVAGESLLNRVNIVRRANQDAASRLDGVANNLKGQAVDVSPAVNRFMANVEEIGVRLDPTPEGLKVLFEGSDIEGLDGIINGLKRVLGRMYNTRAPDAYDVHRLKRYIDETVTYGKNADGLSGNTERILKGLRHDLDQILDQEFPEYNRVNQQYSDTIKPLLALQDVAGKKMDLTGPNASSAVGTLLRRLESNYASRIPLLDAVNNLDQTAKRFSRNPSSTDLVPYQSGAVSAGGDAGTFGSDIGDDLATQVAFADELDRLFGARASTSFQGDIEKAVEGAMTAAGSRTLTGAVADLGIGMYRRTRGINEKNAIKAIRQLLRDGKPEWKIPMRYPRGTTGEEGFVDRRLLPWIGLGGAGAYMASGMLEDDVEESGIGRAFKPREYP